MNEALPMIYLVRHGETAWTLTAQHTGRTDLPLTEQGERQARALSESLGARRIDRTLPSPLRRARSTAAPATPHAPAREGTDHIEWGAGGHRERNDMYLQ